MNLNEAQTLATELINKNAPGWSFGWDRSKRRFGCAHYRTRLITLSLELVMRNTVEQVKDTILHECAHAIAGFQAGHGPVWKQAARNLGASDSRCYDSATVVKADH